MTRNDLNIIPASVLVMAAAVFIKDEPGCLQLLDEDSSVQCVVLPDYMRILCALSTLLLLLSEMRLSKSVRKGDTTFFDRQKVVLPRKVGQEMHLLHFRPTLKVWLPKKSVHRAIRALLHRLFFLKSEDSQETD